MLMCCVSFKNSMEKTETKQHRHLVCHIIADTKSFLCFDIVEESNYEPWQVEQIFFFLYICASKT